MSAEQFLPVRGGPGFLSTILYCTRTVVSLQYSLKSVTGGSQDTHGHTRAHHHATAETAADSTAAGPEPTAPRGPAADSEELKKPPPANPTLPPHPLPERLPAPARRRSAK